MSSEIANHRFKITTDKPDVKVSCQITGVRQDGYAKAHPLFVEQELHGASEQRGIERARHQQMMKKVQENKAQQAANAMKPAAPGK